MHDAPESRAEERISASTRTHANWVDVLRALAEPRPLTDGEALAVAAGFQDMSASGVILAQLATTGRVKLRELLNAIETEWQWWQRQPETSERVTHRSALEALDTWAREHPSRETR